MESYRGQKKRAILAFLVHLFDSPVVGYACELELYLRHLSFDVVLKPFEHPLCQLEVI